MAEKKTPAAAPAATAPAPKPKQKGVWFETIAKIATENSDTQYSADDVRNILKAWRMEYQGRKKAKKAAEKAAKAAAETGEE